jgi:hypothetical protein
MMRLRSAAGGLDTSGPPHPRLGGDMTETWKARPTTYRGIKMRSRLEATYAAILDQDQTLGWTYEPRAFADATGQYLPDFEVELVRGEPWAFVEVKPTVEAAQGSLARMQIIWSSIPDAPLIAVVPRLGFFIAFGDTRRKWNFHLLTRSA